MRLRLGVLIFVLLAAGPASLSGPAAEQNPLDLPAIGDPADAVLPLSREQKLGKAVVRELRAKLSLVSDIEINEYLTALGTQLITANPQAQLQFHFLLVNSHRINAFATIGGIVAINSGLFLSADNESQVAGVLAHELAHVTQRHAARMMAAANRLSWINVLAVLGALVAATHDSDLGQLGIYAGTALPLEQSLKYSRLHEHEADRLGIRLMATAGIHPQGMTQFFSLLLGREGRSLQAPEFLRTHPLTAERVSNALNLVSQLNGDYRSDSWEFRYAKARLQGLLDPQDTIKDDADTPVGIYRKAVALIRLHRHREAVSLLRGITGKRDRLPVRLALAQAEIARGNYREAGTILDKLNKIHPGRETVSYYYALALLKQKHPSSAFAVLEPIAFRKNHQPQIDKLLAEITFAQKKPWISHEYMAEYYEANGQIDAALNQLKKAETYKGSHVFHARIKAKHKAIKQLQKDLENPLP